ncbi:MAG TPA: NAD+ synthase [Acidimicrobiales bacterium]|nr:NAD+ synthase [Acidimicrobiales bacterium]
MSHLRVALCQLDTVVGEVDGNAERIIEHLARAEADGSDVAAFPELAITGYPPEDLLFKPAFVADNLAAIHRVASATAACVAIVGFVDVAGHDDVGDAVTHASGAGTVAREAAIRGAPRRLRNAVAVCAGGAVRGVYHKRRLPNYGVFDEERWFAPGTAGFELYEIAGVPVGVSICEDLWFPDGPVRAQASGGARLVVNVNASPFSIGRRSDRLAVSRQRVAEAGCAIAYVNQVGGQDELVFDGGSFVMDRTGEVVAAAEGFAETVLVVDVPVPSDGPGPGPGLPTVLVSAARRDPAIRAAPPVPAPLDEEAQVYEALVLGTRDYLRKNGFTDAVVGLSGGIDSSLVAAVAVDALGAAHVHGLAMPSRYSSPGSVTDATALADHLGIDLRTVPIEAAHEALAGLIGTALGEVPTGLTDENLQSRIRGVLLMAVSNARGWIVLTTGNKSELATGYSTLYGDSAGGFAVIKDVPKTLVYRLCRYRNASAGADVIPASVLVKPPSAELRPDQRDDQSLPPYDVLDPLLDALVLHDRSIADVAGAGYDPALVARVAALVDRAEYKRRQSPPGVRITAKAFGKDRRMPITNRYRDHAPATVVPPAPAATATATAAGAAPAGATVGAEDEGVGGA